MISITCIEPVQAHKALMHQVWPEVKARCMAGHRVVVEVKQEKRSGQENRLLHSLIGQIAVQKEWAGAKRDVETWKRLLVAAWCRAKNEQIEFLPAIDGNGVDIVFRRTSQLTKGECADLIEFVFAWGAMNDVKFPARVDPETGEILN